MDIDCPVGAGVPVTSPQLYSAGHTDDLRQALFYISHRYPEAPLLGLSFSLGANVMTRYVAEEGECSRLKSACVLGCVRVSPRGLSLNSNNFIYQ
jgi:predicted alpha/beta-fold hydrolase